VAGRAISVRIVFLTDWMRPGAGVSVACAEMAVHLHARAIDVTIAGVGVRDVERVLERPCPFSVRELGELGHEPLERLRTILRHVDALDGLAADVLVPVTFPFETVAGLTATPAVLYDHGTVPSAGAPPPVARALETVTQSFQHALPHCAGVICPSAYLADRLKGEPVAVRVVHNGADHLPMAACGRVEARRGLGWQDHEAAVLLVGRSADDARYKGVLELLKALQDLGWAGREPRVVHIGRCSESDAAQMEALGAAVLGVVSRRGLALAYRAADLVVSASSWEGFNLPLAEAQFQGTPVAALAVGAHAEVVTDACALHSDIGGLARAVLSVRLTTGDDAPAGVLLTRFTWARAAESFEAALVSIIRTRSPNRT
jgi:glycosyltransferase involved in cell wall biosynthesis